MPEFGTRQNWHDPADAVAGAFGADPDRSRARDAAAQHISRVPTGLPADASATGGPTEASAGALPPKTVTVVAPPPPGLASGTLIATRRGSVPVERLRPGDRLQTLDEGLAPLIRLARWRAAAQGARAPVLIAAGVLGNDRALMLAPGHRLLLRPEAGPLADQEVLVAAAALVGAGGVTRAPQSRIDWFAPILDQHAVIFAENARIESLLPLPDALGALSPEDRAALESSTAIRPGIALPVRPIVPEARARRLLLRHGCRLGLPDPGG